VRDYRVHLLVKALNELDYAATIADEEGLSDCVEAIAAAESYINSVRKALRRRDDSRGCFTKGERSGREWN